MSLKSKVLILTVSVVLKSISLGRVDACTFMYLGESFKAILEEHDINPIDYNEGMNDMDAHI